MKNTLENLTDLYEEKKHLIKSRLEEFKNLKKEDYFKEFIFCLLTPQSNAKKCWQAVEEISLLKSLEKNALISILKTKTRFHNNKAGYILKNMDIWNNILSNLSNPNRLELRNFIKQNVKGYGLKEASHFLRNIGKSDNRMAILDRHILRNLKSLNIISNDKIKSNKHYLEIEKKFIHFSKQIKIPIDELDLLFWSKENGVIFK